MSIVTFLPANRTVEVASGTALLDAAVRAGVVINAPCGGEGVCGECRVRVAQGSVECLPSACLGSGELDEGWVLACASRVRGDVTVQVNEEDAGEGSIIIDEGADVHGARAHSARAATPAQPVVAKLALRIEPPSLDNNFSDFDRLTHAIRASGVEGELTCRLDLLRRLASILRVAEHPDHHVTATLANLNHGSIQEVIRVEQGAAIRSFGLAIDVGTTTCAVRLVDLARNRILGVAADINAQRARGLDVISRINYARRPERREELRALALGTLNDLIVDLCEKSAVRPEEIDNAAIAGNTTMIHLLLGLDPEFIRLEPYSPTVHRVPLLAAREVGLRMNPDAYVLFAPAVGSYVGGDITAGLLTTAMADSDDEAVSLFLDIGTNGEIVVGNSEWLMACAASAGPAFEGCGIRCGMRASTGAIERVRIDEMTGRASVSVLGGGAPRGICGSCLIDLLAELWQAGLLDPAGKLIPERGRGLIRPSADSERNLVYTVVPASESATEKPITISEHDIVGLLRAKAAIYSACSLMLRQVGLDFDAVARVYVAGGFGRTLDLERSIAIGLLPDLPLEKFIYLGNSALAGAHAILTRQSARAKVMELADRITYLDLCADPSYMDEYMAALFLPHTDPRRFPSLMAEAVSQASKDLWKKYP